MAVPMADKPAVIKAKPPGPYPPKPVPVKPVPGE